MSKKYLIRISGVVASVAIIGLLVRLELLSDARRYFIPIILFLLTVWCFFIWRALNTLPSQKEKKQSNLDKTSSLFPQKVNTVIVVSLLTTFIFLGLLDIHKQSLVDEPLWIFDRVERYSHRIVDGNLELSRPSDKPGLTVSLLASAALFKYPTPSALEATITPEIREELFALMRTPIFLFVTLLIFLFYRSLRSFVGGDIALVTLGLITLSPVLLGMSRIINPDAILWVLLPLSIFTFAQALQNPTKKTILYAGLIFGLALLTKYIANILLIFFPVMIVLWLLYTAKPTDKSSELQSRLVLMSQVFALIISVGVILFCIALPSTWVEPLDILKGTVLSQAFGSLGLPWVIAMITLYADIFARKKSFCTQILQALVRWSKFIAPSLAVIMIATIGFVFWSAHANTIIDYYTALRSPKSVVDNTNLLTVYFTGFYVLIFGVGIPILVGSIIGLISLLNVRKLQVQDVRIRYSVVVAGLFILFYYAGHVVSGVAPILRYQIVVFPLLILIAAYGIVLLFANLSSVRTNVFLAITALLLGYEIVQVKPFYMSYASSLLPDGDVLNIKDMGDGSYQIAQYINSLPNNKELSIWADKAGICAMISARCTTTVDATRIKEQNLTFDYFIITKGREFLISRDDRTQRRRSAAPEISLAFESLYTSDHKPVYEITPGNNQQNYIRIFDSGAIQYANKRDQ